MKKKPRLGFLGLGWIGTQRMQAVAESGRAEIVALADPSREALKRAAVPQAQRFQSLAPLLKLDLDGLVIATPSALHAEQSIAALEQKIAVFCQKPLGRTAAEVAKIIETARQSDVLLGIDLSYRFTQAVAAICEAANSGALGRLYAANLVFHNAYGPDKKWFYDAPLSGGGCVIDLGTHLVDLALLLMKSPMHGVSSRLFRGGEPIAPAKTRCEVEDFAIARLDFASGATAQIACSWNLNAGQDAVIEASFYGERGGASLRNLKGSFCDFTTELFQGTSRRMLAEPPDAWGPRALLDWVDRLAAGARFDCEVNSAIEVAKVIDAIYQSR
ncbi:MAG: Gfo/Idh/MocA family oxidoreductase [Verrucomicrobia bacterium]|nr:Gfo/Idh/MocA family oxidoreductase [Verrucomicrobiota bacterium]